MHCRVNPPLDRVVKVVAGEHGPCDRVEDPVALVAPELFPALFEIPLSYDLLYAQV